MPFISSFTSAYGYGRNAGLNYDSNFDKTVLLMHMNGVNGSTVFKDSSKFNKTINVFGGAQISTTEFKFGGASGYFNNIDSFLTVNHDSSLDFPTGDWTIELFCRIDPVETDILINKSDGLGFYGYQLRIINNKFSVKGYGPNPVVGPVYELGEDVGPNVVPNVWYHVAATRQVNNFYLYVNGVLVDSTVYSGNLYTSPSPLSIGGTSDGEGLTSGYIDELRITKGLCRYPNGIEFIPPYLEFQDE